MADGDPNLKDRLLNELSSSIGPATDGLASETPAPPPPAIPDHTLLRRIGKGSYGEVWLARNALGMFRAVKIVHRRAFDSDRPYEREFAGIRRFEPVSRSHPSQLNVLHVGRDDAAGHFYYVMELADDASGASVQCSVNQYSESPGVSGLQQQLNTDALNTEYSPKTLRSDLSHRGRLPCDECLQIGLALATALDHLHRHGLVHRDIKPSNIVFVGGIPKLADIGLVTHVEATLSFVGTEGYLPPEGPGTPQADIFSLGKVLYEMATGRDRQDYPELPTNLIEAPAADRAALAELNEVIVKACHADAKERYQTAAELHADLALLQSGKSVSRMRTVERRLQFVARAGAAVTVLALLAGGAWFWQQRQTRHARELALQNRQLAEEKTTLADEKTKLADNLTKLDAENRNRIVRLDIANGIRLLDQGDPAGALLWFADALPLLTNISAEESIHRSRIQQTLDQTPRVLNVLPHDSEVVSGAFSPDGRFIATGTKDGSLRIWNAMDSKPVWGPKRMVGAARFLRFSRDGQRLLASSSWEQGMFNGYLAKKTFLAVLDSNSGLEVFPADPNWSGMLTNVVCAHFSPDDRWLARSERGGVIRVLNLENGRQVTELRGHTDDVAFLSFSADGSLLASASLDRTVRLWRLPSGEPFGLPLEHRWPVVRALLTDDGQYLITAAFAKPGSAELGEDAESEVQAWDVPGGRRLGDPIPTGGWLAMLVAPGTQGRFFADGVSLKDASGVQAYDFARPAKAVFSRDIGVLHSWAFSKDGSRFAFGGGDHVARAFDARSGAPLTQPLRHVHWGVNSVQFSPDDKFLLTGSSDGNARLWDLRPIPAESSHRTLPAPLQQLNPEVFAAQTGRAPERTPIFLIDGSLRLFGEQLEELHRWQNPQPGMRFRGIESGWHSNQWAMKRYDPDPKAVLLWRPEGGETRGFILGHSDEVHSQVFTRDDRFLITNCRDGTIRFWRTSDGGMERMVRAPEGLPGGIAQLSPDGRTALWVRALPSGLMVQFLDLDSEKLIGEARTLFGAFFETAFSPDGKRIAFLDDNGPVTVLESRTGRLISSTIAHTSNLIWVEWHPDGRRLLTTGHDDQVLVWDLETGTQLLGPLRTPGGTIRVARWSSDGQFIIARNDEKQVQVWDSATGEAVTPPLNHAGDVAFAFMTRSNRLISASYPDQLRAWDLKETPLPPDILVDYAKLLSGRRLSATGALLALKPGELAELNRSLRARAPQLFER